MTLNEVLELCGAAVRPVDDVMAIGPRGRAVAPREAAALIAEVQRGADVCRDRPRCPSDRKRQCTRAPGRRGPTVSKWRNRYHGPYRVAGEAARGFRMDRTHATQLGRLCIGFRAQRVRAHPVYWFARRSS